MCKACGDRFSRPSRKASASRALARTQSGEGAGARCACRRPGLADLRDARSVLTYWRGRGGDRFSRPSRKASASRALARTQLGEGAGARCGDQRPGFADLRKARSMLTYWRGRGGDRFSRPSRKASASRAVARTQSGEGVGARFGDLGFSCPAALFGGCPTGNLHIQKAEFQAIPRCSFRKKPQACSRTCAVCDRCSGSVLWRLNAFRYIRVRVRECGRKHSSAIGALHVSAFVQRRSKIIPCSIAQPSTAGCGWDLTFCEIC